VLLPLSQDEAVSTIVSFKVRQYTIRNVVRGTKLHTRHAGYKLERGVSLYGSLLT
jgi:hypothetical protein